MGGEIVCSQTHLHTSGLWKSWTSLFQLITNDAKLDSPPSFNAPPLASLPKIELFLTCNFGEQPSTCSKKGVLGLTPANKSSDPKGPFYTLWTEKTKQKEFYLVSYSLSYYWGFSWFTSIGLKQNSQCLCMILNFHVPGWISHTSLRLLSGILLWAPTLFILLLIKSASSLPAPHILNSQNKSTF